VTDEIIDKNTNEPVSASYLKRTWKHVPRKRIALLMATLATAFAALWYGIDWWKAGRFVETTDDAYVGGNVTVISPHVSGYIADILVKDNQFVQAGQPLIRLEDRDFKAALDAADALVAERKASLNRLHAQHDLEQALMRKAEADLDEKKASAEFRALDATRYRNLAQTQAGSQQNAERSRTMSQEAQASVASAKAGLLAARQQLAVIDTQIVEAMAALSQTEAQKRTAWLNFGYTEIRSPIDGYVGDRSAHPGTYTMAGTQLLSIVPANGLWVDANFKEDQLHDMKPGEPVEVIADITRSRLFHGHVESLSPATGAVFSVIPPQNATGNFTKIVQRVPVRIKLDDDVARLGILRPGLSTTVSVDTRSRAGKTP
jgi:membrane fusion protein (multidrug efflux system)